jgi:hypothetical protein
VGGRIVSVSHGVVVVDVERSSHYPTRTLLRIKTPYVPPGMRCVGERFGFNIPAEFAPSILVDEMPPSGESGPSTTTRAGSRAATQATEPTPRPTEAVTEHQTDGIAQVQSYLSRLFGRAGRASVVISTLDGSHAILLLREAGQTFLSVSVDRTTGGRQERAAREFFTRVGLFPLRDRLSASCKGPSTTHTWHFRLADDVGGVSALCAAIFTQLFGIDPQQGLRFSLTGI